MASAPRCAAVSAHLTASLAHGSSLQQPAPGSYPSSPVAEPKLGTQRSPDMRSPATTLDSAQFLCARPQGLPPAGLYGVPQSKDYRLSI
jgi:hypothetical protein